MLFNRIKKSSLAKKQGQTTLWAHDLLPVLQKDKFRAKSFRFLSSHKLLKNSILRGVPDEIRGLVWNELIVNQC